MDNQHYNILIVDDDPRNVFALSATLKAMKYRVHCCTSALESFQYLKTGEKTDVLLLDMMMPEMDGYEALALLRAQPEMADLPIVAVTAQAMAGDREKCLAAGASAYLSKPIDVDKLRELLEEFTRK